MRNARTIPLVLVFAAAWVTGETSEESVVKSQELQIALHSSLFTLLPGKPGFPFIRRTSSTQS